MEVSGRIHRAIVIAVLLSTLLTGVEPSFAGRLTCERILSLAPVLLEPSSAPIVYRASQDLKVAKKRLEEERRQKNPIESSNEISEWIRKDRRPVRSAPWGSEDVEIVRTENVFERREVKVSRAQLREELQRSLPQELAVIANETVDRFYDKRRVDSWIASVRQEVLQRMWDDGLRDPKVLEDVHLSELYLDRVLAMRAAKHGFRITKDGQPFKLVTFGSWSFFKFHLAQGKLFNDWTGLDITTFNGAKHDVRSHSLPVAYAAENVPDFIYLYRYMGRTGDRDGVWSMLFDNSNSAETPLWGGKWVSTYQDYLHIRY